MGWGVIGQPPASRAHSQDMEKNSEQHGPQSHNLCICVFFLFFFLIFNFIFFLILLIPSTFFSSWFWQSSWGTICLGWVLCHWIILSVQLRGILLPTYNHDQSHSKPSGYFYLKNRGSTDFQLSIHPQVDMAGVGSGVRSYTQAVTLILTIGEVEWGWLLT